MVQIPMLLRSHLIFHSFNKKSFPWKYDLMTFAYLKRKWTNFCMSDISFSGPKKKTFQFSLYYLMYIVLYFLDVCSTFPQVVQDQLKIFFWKILCALKKKKGKIKLRVLSNWIDCEKATLFNLVTFPTYIFWFMFINLKYQHGTRIWEETYKLYKLNTHQGNSCCS